MTRSARNWLALLATGLIGVQSGFCGNGFPPPDVEKAAGSTLSEMAADPGRYDGRTVTLEGNFQGWEVSGCTFPEGAATRGRTRGDWLFRVGMNCFYVTGGFPEGLDALFPANIGVRIALEARPARDEGGRMYLVYRSSRRLP